MAQKIITSLIDDLDGTVLDGGKGETVTFGYKGKRYEIDLSTKNAKKFEDAIKPYVSAGRQIKAGGTLATVTRLKSAGPTAQAELKALRDWAEKNGYAVAARGRVSAEVRAAYEASKS